MDDCGKQGINITREMTYYPRVMARRKTEGAKCTAPGKAKVVVYEETANGVLTIQLGDWGLYYTGDAISIIEVEGWNLPFIGTTRLNEGSGDQFKKKNGRDTAMGRAMRTAIKAHRSLNLVVDSVSTHGDISDCGIVPVSVVMHTGRVVAGLFDPTISERIPGVIRS
jgi:hypothetical protein